MRLHTDSKKFDEPVEAIEDERLPQQSVHEENTTNSAPTPEAKEANSIQDEDSAPKSDDDDLIRIKVSSKHLTLACPYFKRNFGSGMAESCTLRRDGFLCFELDQHPGATLILANILHGRFWSVPKSVDLNLLTHFAVLVDYLECYEAVEPFTDRWIEELTKSMSTIYCKDLIQWFCISWVFRLPKQFEIVTGQLSRCIKSPLQTFGLPIPSNVIGMHFLSDSISSIDLEFFVIIS